MTGMYNKTLEKFVLDLPGFTNLNKKQKVNVSKLIEVSKNFSDLLSILNFTWL